MLKTSKSHYSASLSFPPGYNDRSETREAREAAVAERKAQQAALKALGFREQYFQFRDGDEAGKAAAKVKADAEAARWAERTGFRFTVSEGFFMGF